MLSLRQLMRGEILTILLYGAGFLALLNGQFGQPTNLGFAVFIGGLILASANKGKVASEMERLEPAQPARPQMARRSPYAEQLHHSSAAPAPRDSDDSPDW
jgi:hypothetical protein